MKNDICNFRAAGYTHGDLNKSRNAVYQNYRYHLNMARKMKDPQKRAERMKLVNELYKKWKSMPIKNPTNTGMKDAYKMAVGML